mgnify:CR=1 FL=1
MITITVDTRDTTRWLDDIQRRHVPFAMALALTRTAKAAEAAARDEFVRVFDRPTPFTLKSLRTKTATKRDLTAMVYMKDRYIGGGQYLGAAEILGHHFSGGVRVRKSVEHVLQRNGFIDANEYVVPGGAARLDRYGNMSRGQVIQILSQIGVKNIGSDSTPTGSKRSKRSVAKAGTIFWSRGPSGRRIPVVDKDTGITYGYRGGSASKLPKGAWIRRGRTVQPILIVVNRANYSKRIDLLKIVQKTVDEQFSRQFEAALSHALSTQR